MALIRAALAAVAALALAGPASAAPAAVRDTSSVDLKQEFVGYVPERLIVFRNVQAPPLPGAALYPRLSIVVELRPAGEGRTEVVLSQAGYGSGADFDALYSFFQSHNPDFLTDLKAYVEK